MDRTEVIHRIGKSGVIVILRNACETFVDEHIPALIDSGLAAIEVSTTADNYAACFTKLIKHHGGQIVIGAGTVFTTAQAQSAVDGGAQFLISPHFDEKLAEFILGKGIPYIAGCLTPTEVASAIQAGVDAVKIFPASLGGPRYIAALRAPFPGVRFIPTGGVAPVDAPAYWEAGAWAIAVGSELGILMRRPDATAQLRQLFSHLQDD
jgi:2-dehydro-3-deoxyphosphogluconate aldolase / (4S)-4-hydroxy-2-oxoglutarate aldolase